PRRATRKGRNHFPGVRLCSAQGRPFSRQASRARGQRGWYLLCPEVPKLLKALWPAVPARSALLPACGSVVLPTPWGPRPKQPDAIVLHLLDGAVCGRHRTLVPPSPATRLSTYDSAEGSRGA